MTVHLSDLRQRSRHPSTTKSLSLPFVLPSFVPPLVSGTRPLLVVLPAVPFVVLFLQFVAPVTHAFVSEAGYHFFRLSS